MTEGASIEALELWALSLREVKEPDATAVRAGARSVERGVVCRRAARDERRKTGWMRAEAAGDPGPWRQQAVLGRDRWDADALRDLVRDYVTEHLADDNAVLVIDETGFLKQGKASCGVARQYTGSAGEDYELPDRCFCCLRVASWPCLHRSRALFAEGLDRRSGSPEDPYVPGDVSFATKPQLAAEMIERALGLACRSAGLRPIASMGSAISTDCQAGKGYVLGINSNHWFASWGKPQRVINRHSASLCS